MFPDKAWFLVFLVVFLADPTSPFVCEGDSDICVPYDHKVYAKGCPDDFYQCENDQLLVLFRGVNETRLTVMDTYFQTFPRDPCIPLKKVDDGHWDCPHHDDENGYINCTNGLMSCDIKKGYSVKYTVSNQCFEKRLFCDVYKDRDCYHVCNLKPVQRQEVPAKKLNVVHCDTKLEFNCGSFCIPKIWQHDHQVDCIGKEDEVDTPSTVYKCLFDEHKCQNEAKCIPKEKVCDKIGDCLGSTDEFNCSRSCGEHEFKCLHGPCIPFKLTCDGAFDCFDHSDEFDCAIKKNRKANVFHCDYLGSNISKKLVCDGNKDCPNGLDEEHCEISSICDKQHFECVGENMCVPRSYMCDGVDDCNLGSDEKFCPDKRSCPFHQKLCQDGICREKCADDICIHYQFLLPNGHCGFASDFCNGAFNISVEGPFWTCAEVKNTTYYKCDPKDENCERGEWSCCNKQFTFYRCKYGYTNRQRRGCEKNPQIVTSNACSPSELFCYPGFYRLRDQRLLIEEKYNARILMTSLHEVKYFDVMTGKVQLLLSTRNSMAATAYWIANNTLFWSDPSARQIVYCEFPVYETSPDDYCVESVKVLVTNVSSHSISFDWVHEALYFSDDENLSINVVTLAFPERKTLVRNSFQSFRDIHVDPALGVVHFISSGVHYQFHAGSEDATEELMEESTMDLPHGVSAMYFDVYAKAVYYAQPKFSRVYSLTESNEMIPHASSTTIYNPIFSLIMFDETLYWTDQFGMHTVDPRPWIIHGYHLTEGNGRPIHLQVIHKTAQVQFTDKCRQHTCEQMCIPRSWHYRKYSNTTYVCNCVDGYTVHNGKCITNEKFHVIAKTTVLPTSEGTTTKLTTSEHSQKGESPTTAGSPSAPARKKTGGGHFYLAGILILASLFGIFFAVYYLKDHCLRAVGTPERVQFNVLDESVHLNSLEDSSEIPPSTSFTNSVFGH